MNEYEMTDHVLYRFYNATGQLLYVGITMNPAQRFKAHRREKDWWADVSGITVEKYGNREELSAAERRAIKIERPMFNVVHNGPEKIAASASSSIAGRSLVFRCKSCKNPVVGKSGYIHVNYRDISAHRLAWMQLKKRKREEAIDKGFVGEDGEPLAIGYSGRELMDMPEPARWRIHHRDCDPEPDEKDYWFDVGRADSYPKLLKWTAHLLGKRWISDTNWDEFIYSHLDDRARTC